jgi:uncharacterized protein with NRDE domain
MCTLAIYFQTCDRFPLAVAANRDEFYERPSAPPAGIAVDPWVVGGQDRSAGGTWLAVNAHHLLAGLLNRRSALPIEAARRSRGLLCLDALAQPGVAAAVAVVCRESAGRYNPFNLLLASPDAACVISNGSGAMHRTPLSPGLHLLTNLDLNDFECPRIAKSYHLFDDLQPVLRRADAPASFVDAVREILSDHSTPLDPRELTPPNNLCVHTEHYGTRSSTVVVFDTHDGRFRMWHADGAPCRTPYREVALPS